MNIGEPDYAFDYDEISLIVGRMWRGAQPGIVFQNAWGEIICRGRPDCRIETAITRLTANRERDRLARDDAFFEWVKPRLERNYGFRTLVRHYADLGIACGYTKFEEYSGQMHNWGIIVKPVSLPQLESLAQTEAGFITDDDRATAARDFRIYADRNIAENWEENRKRLPPIDTSPYNIWL
jgi:hypothetical protein